MGIFSYEGPYFYGTLVSGEALEKASIERKTRYYEIKIDKKDLKTYLEQGWEVQKEVGEKIVLRKSKNPDELLENEVWLLFKEMGFEEMNKDRKFRIQAGELTKQIDVFAKDKENNNIFLIECKYQNEKGPRSLRKDISEILTLKQDIIVSIRKQYKEKLRLCFLIVTKNIEWNPKEEELAKQNGIFIWKDEDLESYRLLVDQLGETAKFQMFSILLQNRKCKELERIEVPALRGGKGKKKYYVFVIQPEKLLRIAYVHRRESNPKDVQETYQRMISKPRLTKIQEFIEKGGFFPNNIIINFTQRPIFLQTGKTKHTGIVYGILKFPHYYGCAWVIDGQHRLYGYSKTKKKFDDTLCVLAFEGLSISEQAKLFVEINKEQKKVSSNLLWELYKDIYANSDDPKQQYLWCISCITYKLNFNKDSPLFSHIAFPSCIIKDKKLTNLTLANICDGIEENGIVKEKDSLLFHNTYSDTVDFTYERLKAFFEFLKEELKEDWECGDEGLIRTNVGVRIFLIIFRQLLKYLKYRGEEEVYLKKDLSTFKEKCKEILGPVIDKIKVMSKTGKDEIRKGSVKVKIMENTQKLVWPLRERINFGIELWKKGGWTPEVDESDESIKHFIDETEVKLREFIREKLKKVYGKEWWEKGIPDGVKEYAETKIKQEITQKFYPSEKMLSPEEKLEFISTSHYREIITKKNNWPYFTEIFSEDKEVTSASFKFFENLRNAFKHNRKLDEITKKLGYWHMRWIRRCIGLETPNIS